MVIAIFIIQTIVMNDRLNDHWINLLIAHSDDCHERSFKRSLWGIVGMIGGLLGDFVFILVYSCLFLLFLPLLLFWLLTTVLPNVVWKQQFAIAQAIDNRQTKPFHLFGWLFFDFDALTILVLLAFSGSIHCITETESFRFQKWLTFRFLGE